jgi:hypothetical protein
VSNRRRLKHPTPRWVNVNPALKRAAQEVDALYFDTHPKAKEYERPATPEELQATGYPQGTRVHVAVIGPGVRARSFMPPNERLN